MPLTWGDISRWEDVTIEKCVCCGDHDPYYYCQCCLILVCKKCAKAIGCPDCETPEALTPNRHG